MSINFKLQITDSNFKKHTVLCQELLRDVPGKRSVYRGTWRDKYVIIKIFKKCLGSKRRLLTEWQGLGELKKRNINTPETYFYGQAENGDRVMAVEEICNCQTAIAKIKQTKTTEDKLEIFEMLVDGLAGLNSAGIVQTDLHLGNFLIQDKKVYSLDTAEMKFFDGSCRLGESLKQIAVVCLYIQNETGGYFDRFLELYAKKRNWTFSEKDKAFAVGYANKHKNRTIRKGLKKCLRSGKRQVKIKTKNVTAVFDRNFYSKIDSQSLIDNIDKIMQAGEILKNGNTCFVSSFNYRDINIVGKRYNNKGFLHSIKRTITRSRGRKSWLNGHLLGMLKINTPKPLAFIIVYKNHLVYQSYILTELVEGVNLHRYLEKTDTGENEKQKVKNELTAMINTLHKNRVTHGDIKKPNILITDKGICITDLDAMTRHWCRIYFRNRMNKDIRCLNKLFCHNKT